MKAMNFQDISPSFSIDNFIDHCVLVFDLTLMQDASEIFHYSELVGEPMRREINFTFPLEHVTELIVFGERMSSAAVESWVLWEKLFIMNNLPLHQIINSIPLLKQPYRGCFHSDCVPTLDQGTFAIINTQPSNMQGEQWITIANFCRKSSFADSFGRPSFLKQQYKQTIPEPL